jgi:response regulator of citrate/malate metabolism
MRKKLNSTADFKDIAINLVKGGTANKAELAKWGLEPVSMQKALDVFINADAKQEKAKSEAQQSTVDFTAAKKDLAAEIARWVSTLEANYGKTGEKLGEFGIAPRMMRPHKGPRTQKTQG